MWDLRVASKEKIYEQLAFMKELRKSSMKNQRNHRRKLSKSGERYKYPGVERLNISRFDLNKAS